MKASDLERATQIIKQLDGLEINMKYLTIDSTVGVSLWMNGKGSTSIHGVSISPGTQAAIRALLQVEIGNKIKALEAELEAL